MTYAYGPGGQRTQLGVEGQETVYYEYGPTGSMDRLMEACPPGVWRGKTGLYTYYEYDPAGRARLQHHPNLPAGRVEGAAATYFIYDAAGRLSEKVTKKDSDAGVLVRFAYTRDAAGNPIAIEREPGLGAFYYEYDELQRLAYEACSPAVGRGQFVSDERQYENYYEYDAAGNRTLLRHGETDAEDLTYYAYNGANELTQVHNASGWTYFGYDQNGNTVMEQAPSYTRYFDWDGRDMLVGVRSTGQGWTDNVYRYDGLASRVSTLESGGLTYSDWDSINVVQEKDADGEVTDRQVHGYAPIFSVGDIAVMDKSGTPYVPDFDHVGTTWNLVNSAAAKANSYAYDAFGVARSASETVVCRYRFRGERLASDTPIYQVARMYLAPTGRYMRRGSGYGGQRPPGKGDVLLEEYWEKEDFGFLDLHHRFYVYDVVKAKRATWAQVHDWNDYARGWGDLYAFVSKRGGPYDFDKEIKEIEKLVDTLNLQITRCSVGVLPKATEHDLEVAGRNACVYIAVYGHGSKGTLQGGGGGAGQVPAGTIGVFPVPPGDFIQTQSYESIRDQICPVSCGGIPKGTGIAKGYKYLQTCIRTLLANCNRDCPPWARCAVLVGGGFHYSLWATPWAQVQDSFHVWETWWGKNPVGWAMSVDPYSYPP